MPDTTTAPLDGLWAWVWRPDWHGETPRQTMRRCLDHGVSGAFVRAWNGEIGRAPDGFSFRDAYVRYLDQAPRGFRVLPWTYVYGPALGNDPVREASTFVQAVGPFEPPVLIVDVEHEGTSREYGGRPDATEQLFGTLESLVGRDRLAFTTYDLPGYHSQFRPDGGSVQRGDGLAYHVMARHCRYGIPQVYFAGRSVKGRAALDRAVSQWRAYNLDVELRPAIDAVGISGPHAREVAEAVPGVSLWRYDLIEPAVWRSMANLAKVKPPTRKHDAKRGVPRSADAWVAYRAEHKKMLVELAAGADAVRLANKLAGRLTPLDEQLAFELTRLNTHFGGRG